MKKLSVFLCAMVFIFGVAGIANAALITYDINFTAQNGHAGGTGTIVADITGDPVTSSIISVQAQVDGSTFANDYYSWPEFSATDLEEFAFYVGIGITSPQEDITQTSSLTYPALCFSTQYYTYAIFTDGQNSDVFAPFEVVPIPSAIWLLGSGLVGLVGFRRKLRK